MKFYQTGDVLYFKQKTLPKGLKQIKGNLIHKGTDHLHTITGDFKLYTNEASKDLYIVVKNTSILKHREHKDVKLPKGVYKKAIVMEYDHFKEEARKVID